MLGALADSLRYHREAELGEDEEHHAEDYDHPEDESEIRCNQRHKPLQKHSQQTSDNADKAHAFKERAYDDGGGTQTAGYLGLTRRRFHGGLGQFAYTYGSADCDYTGADCAAYFGKNCRLKN